MKARTILFILLVAFLLWSAGASALSGPRYHVESSTISGGSYQITSFGAPAGSTATGGAYRLQGPSVPDLRGSGCCCTYLPCILRKR
jgi:hypothetical protein